MKTHEYDNSHLGDCPECEAYADRMQARQDRQNRQWATQARLGVPLRG